MQIRTADARAGDADNRIARIQDFGVWHCLNSHLFRTHPANCFHEALLLAFAMSVRFPSPLMGSSGLSTRAMADTPERGPCDWPSTVGISPASIRAFRRRRSCRIIKLGSFPRILANAAPIAPAGGW